MMSAQTFSPVQNSVYRRRPLLSQIWLYRLIIKAIIPKPMAVLRFWARRSVCPETWRFYQTYRTRLPLLLFFYYRYFFRYWSSCSRIGRWNVLGRHSNLTPASISYGANDQNGKAASTTDQSLHWSVSVRYLIDGVHPGSFDNRNT